MKSAEAATNQSKIILAVLMKPIIIAEKQINNKIFLDNL
jgi:hypothetical protein